MGRGFDAAGGIHTFTIDRVAFMANGGAALGFGPWAFAGARPEPRAYLSPSTRNSVI